MRERDLKQGRGAGGERENLKQAPSSVWNPMQAGPHDPGIMI